MDITVPPTRKPNRYPPVGPKRTVKPAVPFENTGKPIAPKSRYKAIDAKVMFTGMLNAMIMTIRDCAVNATDEKGNGIDK